RSPWLERFLSFDRPKGRFTVSFNVCYVFVIVRPINTFAKAIFDLFPKCFCSHCQQCHSNFPSHDLCYLISQHYRSVSFVSLFVDPGNGGKGCSCHASFCSTLFAVAL